MGYKGLKKSTPHHDVVVHEVDEAVSGAGHPIHHSPAEARVLRHGQAGDAGVLLSQELGGAVGASIVHYDNLRLKEKRSQGIHKARQVGL